MALTFVVAAAADVVVAVVVVAAAVEWLSAPHTLTAAALASLANQPMTHTIAPAHM